jgi:two-component system phosphate regulon response regulator PhoB
MASEKIVIVEDETDIREVLIYNFEREGFTVWGAADGWYGLKLIHDKNPDLVLLDLMLPSYDGLEICRDLKSDKATAAIPIIMVTAKGEESDIVAGLALGADDYVTKPFSPKELMARAKAVLRRGRTLPVETDDKRIERNGVIIDSERHLVVVNGETVSSFTATELKLLHFLAVNAGRVFTRDHLLSRVMGEESFVVDRNIDVHIQAIRKKIGRERKIIETIRGIGYRFIDVGE